MDFFVENINLIVILPLIMCAVIGFNALISNKIEKNTLFAMSIAVSFACLIFCAAAFDYSVIRNLSSAVNFQWLTFDKINFYLGIFLDKTSVSFILLSGILCFLIQNIAFIKLKEHNDFPRLLFYLNLFAIGLNGVFISSNIFQTYLFCEITGVASYLMINFDFSNRELSKAGIKSFIFNRIGDLTLLFCVLTIMYYAVIYNQLSGVDSLAFSNINNIAACINSLMSTPVFVFFCSVLLFVILMKFMQAFIYITFESKPQSELSKIVLYQNSLIALIGIFLFLRLNPFFFELNTNLIWTVAVLFVLFAVLGVLNKIFIPLCRFFGWIEKYVIETIINFTELVIRAMSYLCGRLQGGNFQSYLIYSLTGLVLILIFVLIFYEILIKV